MSRRETERTIGELAKAAGVPTSTVRYYERAGLLQPDGRTDSSYRVYGARAFERLCFIRAAQATGFTLDDVKALLAFRDGISPPCREVQAQIEGRLRDVEERLGQLEVVRKVLRSSLRACRRGQRDGACRVIERLDRAAREPEKAASSGRHRGSRFSS